MFIGHYSAAFVAATSPGHRDSARCSSRPSSSISPSSPSCCSVWSICGSCPASPRPNPMDLYDMPWTHSLVGALAWSAGFALLIWLWRRSGTAALIGGAVVFSHWLIDLFVHRPDLTLAGRPPPFGLGLWNYPAIEMPLELILAFGTLGWFARKTRGPWMPARCARGGDGRVPGVQLVRPPADDDRRSAAAFARHHGTPGLCAACAACLVGEPDAKFEGWELTVEGDDLA